MDSISNPQNGQPQMVDPNTSENAKTPKTKISSRSSSLGKMIKDIFVRSPLDKGDFPAHNTETLKAPWPTTCFSQQEIIKAIEGNAESRPSALRERSEPHPPKSPQLNLGENLQAGGSRYRGTTPRRKPLAKTQCTTGGGGPNPGFVGANAPRGTCSIIVL